MGNNVVHVNDTAFQLLRDYCAKTHQKYSQVAEKAIVKMIGEGSTDAELKMALEKANYEMVNQSQRIVKNMMKFINFFDGHADENKEEMLSSLPNIDDEYRELIGDVFYTGKQSAKTVKANLKGLLKILKEIKGDGGEEEPKQLGHPPKHVFGHVPKVIERNVPECQHLRTKLMVVKGDKRMHTCLDCGVNIWSEKRD